MTAVLSLDDLSIGYPMRPGHAGHVALSGVSASLNAGEGLILSGGAGSGKSTLARILSLRPGAPARVVGGTGSVLGAPLRGFGHGARKRARARIGYLPQREQGAILGMQTVAAGLAQRVRQHNPSLDDPAVGQRVAHLLDDARLPLSVLDRFANELSSGQRQRVGLALQLAGDPKFLILDEPTAGLDPNVRPAIAEAITRVQTSGGTVLLVSNEPDLCGSLTLPILTLDRGTPVAYSAGAPQSAKPVSA